MNILERKQIGPNLWHIAGFRVGKTLAGWRVSGKVFPTLVEACEWIDNQVKQRPPLEPSLERWGEVTLDMFQGACEVCMKRLCDHEWADLDVNGYVIRCNYRSDSHGHR
jgi:hypothetical protein